MKRLSLAMAMLLCVASAVHADGLYGKMISMHGSARQEIKDAADDAAGLLEKMTGEAFTTIYGLEPSAIVVAKRGAFDNEPNAAAELATRSLEAFAVISEGSNRLWIIGNTDGAAAHGVYWYLEQLGCRFLAPTDTWTITPKRDSIVLDVKHMDEPTFLVRGAFATGGFGGNLPLDNDRHLQATWRRWMERIRFGGPFKLAGHAGEDFNNRNKREIEAHEEYRAIVDGVRQPFSGGLKPCYSNKDMLDLYTRDRIRKLEEAMDRDPLGPQSFAVSVDPADGGGHCNCPDCVKIGSVSDRVFTWANHVARKLREKYPDKFVSLYGYNQHAMPPSIDLEPNVYVMLVPYGLQYTGLAPDQFIEAWSAKTKRMSVYDYWSITDWANDLPDFPYRSKVAKRIDYWRDHHVESVALQSTASTGGMGVALYAASRLLWNADLDADAVIEGFYIDAFGSAAAPMKRMLDRWGTDFLLSEHELATCYRDLAEADQLCNDDAVQARIDDFKRYVHYVRLWHEYQQQPNKSAERIAAADDLVAYMWRIYESSMVHAYRMCVLLTNRYERHDPALREKWNLKGGDVWQTITPITHDELNALMVEGAAKYQPADFEPMTFDDDLVPLYPQLAASEKMNASPSLAGMVEYVVQVPLGKKSFAFQMMVNKRDTENPGDKVRVFDEDGHEVFTRTMPPDGEWKDVVVDVPAPGRYRMSIYDQKLMFRMKVPGDLHMVMTSHLMATDLAPKMYFFVPRGLKRLAIFQESVIAFEIEDAAGNKIKTPNEKLVLIDIPAGQDGRVWSMRGFKTWQSVRVLNAPRAFALHPETIMVPRALLRGARR